MGYYTEYTFSVIKNLNNIELDTFLGILTDIAEYDFNPDGTTHGIKWYDHEKDMLELCSRFPDCVFLLEGVGEEDGDIWRQYYKHGEVVVRQVPRLVYDDNEPDWTK